MELAGKKIIFIGDSITEGHGTTERSKVYHQVVKELYGLDFAYNYGISGTRIARQNEVSRDNPTWDLTFEYRVEMMERNVDAVVVFGGTNDYGHGDAVFGDIDSDDIYTFCGAVNSLITKLKKEFPNAEIVFMTPIHRLNEKNPSPPDNKILCEYVEAIMEICKKRNVKTIDLFNINPLDPTDEVLVPDGLHPSDDGHRLLGKVVGEELLKL